MDCVTLQQKLEKRAIERLDAEIENDVRVFLNKWQWDSNGSPVKIGDKYLGEIFRNEIIPAIKEALSKKYINEEIQNFIDNVEQTKAALDELG